MPVLRDKDKRQELRHQLYATLKATGVPIPETVKTLRKIVGMDQQQFAKLTGVSLSALRRIEQANGHYNFETLSRILTKFQLHLVVKAD